MLVAGCADSPEDVCHLGARRVLERDDTELGRREEDMEGGGRVSKRGCCLWASLSISEFGLRCVTLPKSAGTFGAGKVLASLCQRRAGFEDLASPGNSSHALRPVMRQLQA